MTNQHPSNPSGKDLSLYFHLIQNGHDGQDRFQAEFTIHNQSKQTLKGNWTIYFNCIRSIVPESVSQGFQIRHINGDFFCLEPTDDFVSLLPDARVSISFVGTYWIIKESDAPLGFYIVYRDEDGQESTPEAMAAPQIVPFTRPEQVRRTINEVMAPPTPESRYDLAKDVSLLPKESLVPIMPSPVFFEKKAGSYSLKPSIRIKYVEELEKEAQFLAVHLRNHLGMAVNIGTDLAGEIRLCTHVEEIHLDSDESYSLSIDGSGIEAKARGGAGIFYAIQSLLQLLEEEDSEEGLRWTLPFVEIEDHPQFAYRGMHLDVARNFHGVATIKKLLDVMSFYKLNTFHFHLTDDEGWRIEIPDLPELTEIGARRGHPNAEHPCLTPSYGSGHDPNDPNSAGNGYYSRAAFIELLRYAADRHITVIPAIDLPGHARAAVQAMEVRYDRYKALGQLDKANEYLLTDWEDRSTYESVQMWHQNVVNIGLESTYRFIEKVIDELISMYSEAEVSLSTIHVGGDEVPAGAWLDSPACRSLMEAHINLQNVHDLAQYFLKRVIGILASKGLKTAGWEETVLSHKEGKLELNPALVEDQIMPYTWNTIWGDGGEEIPYRLANLGYQVVLSNAPNFYFDMAYNNDPEEAGFYWAGYSQTKDTFRFVPMNLFLSAERDAKGNLIDPAVQYKDAERLSETGRRNILGLQGQIWSETIHTAERLEYMLFPRMCALAERAWSAEPRWATIQDSDQRQAAFQEEWNTFANRLGQIELPRLDRLLGGFGYRIPMAGAKIENGHVYASMPFPGLTIRYTVDGSEPSASSPIYQGPIPLTDAGVRLRLFASDGRSGRMSVVLPIKG